MKSFFEVRKNTRKKLGRELCEKEIEFLQWMHKRYKQDLQKNCKKLDRQN